MSFTPECPKCHKPGVAVRYSKKNGREYLANVETRVEWRGSYFRSLHTDAECAEYAADQQRKVDNKIAFDAAVAAHNEKRIELDAQIKARLDANGKQWDDVCEDLLREALNAPQISDYPGAWV